MVQHTESQDRSILGRWILDLTA